MRNHLCHATTPARPAVDSSGLAPFLFLLRLAQRLQRLLVLRALRLRLLRPPFNLRHHGRRTRIAQRMIHIAQITRDIEYPRHDARIRVASLASQFGARQHHERLPHRPSLVRRSSAQRRRQRHR